MHPGQGAYVFARISRRQFMFIVYNAPDLELGGQHLTPLYCHRTVTFGIAVPCATRLLSLSHYPLASTDLQLIGGFLQLLSWSMACLSLESQQLNPAPLRLNLSMRVIPPLALLMSLTCWSLLQCMSLLQTLHLLLRPWHLLSRMNGWLHLLWRRQPWMLITPGILSLTTLVCM